MRWDDVIGGVDRLGRNKEVCWIALAPIKILKDKNKKKPKPFLSLCIHIWNVGGIVAIGIRNWEYILCELWGTERHRESVWYLGNRKCFGKSTKLSIPKQHAMDIYTIHIFSCGISELCSLCNQTKWRRNSHLNVYTMNVYSFNFHCVMNFTNSYSLYEGARVFVRRVDILAIGSVAFRWLWLLKC